MASSVIYTASWSADKWVDWLASGRRRKRRRRNELDSLLLLILRYFLWKWERLLQTNPQQDISFGLGIRQSLEAENWPSSQQLNGTPAFLCHPGKRRTSIVNDWARLCSLNFCSFCRKLMSAIFWLIYHLNRNYPHTRFFCFVLFFWENVSEYLEDWGLRGPGSIPPQWPNLRLIIGSDMAGVPQGLWLSEQLN